MKSGQSYITITEKDNPKDKIIVALKAKGINNAEVVYAPTFDSDCGWTMVNSDKGSTWLGYTRKEALGAINIMPMNRDYSLKQDVKIFYQLTFYDVGFVGRRKYLNGASWNTIEQAEREYRIIKKDAEIMARRFGRHTDRIKWRIESIINKKRKIVKALK